MQRFLNEINAVSVVCRCFSQHHTLLEVSRMSPGIATMLVVIIPLSLLSITNAIARRL